MNRQIIGLPDGCVVYKDQIASIEPDINSGIATIRMKSGIGHMAMPLHGETWDEFIVRLMKIMLFCNLLI